MLPKMVGVGQDNLPETEGQLLPSLDALAVCDTAPSGTVPFFDDRPVSEEKAPVLRTQPVGESQTIRVPSLPMFWASEGYQKWRQKKGSKTASASCVGT